MRCYLSTSLLGGVFLWAELGYLHKKTKVLCTGRGSSGWLQDRYEDSKGRQIKGSLFLHSEEMGVRPVLGASSELCERLRGRFSLKALHNQLFSSWLCLPAEGWALGQREDSRVPTLLLHPWVPRGVGRGTEKIQALAVRLSNLQSWFPHLLAWWLWGRYLISVFLSFSSVKMKGIKSTHKKYAPSRDWGSSELIRCRGEAGRHGAHAIIISTSSKSSSHWEVPRFLSLCLSHQSFLILGSLSRPCFCCRTNRWQLTIQ